MTRIHQLLADAFAPLRSDGVTPTEFARRTGMVQSHVSRALEGKREVSFANMERWLDECGRRLVTVPVDAASPDEFLALPIDLQQLLLQLGRAWPEDRYLREMVGDALRGAARRAAERAQSEQSAEADGPTSQEIRAKVS